MEKYNRYTKRNWRETEKEHLSCYNKLAEIEDKLDSGKIIELPYLHHHESGQNGITQEFWQIVYRYKGVMCLSGAFSNKDFALNALKEIQGWQEDER